MALSIFKGSDKRILQVICEEGPRSYTDLRIRMTRQKPFFAETAVTIGISSLTNRGQIFLGAEDKYFPTEKGLEVYNRLIAKN